MKKRGSKFMAMAMAVILAVSCFAGQVFAANNADDYCMKFSEGYIRVWPVVKYAAGTNSTFSVFYDINYSQLPASELANDIQTTNTSYWVHGFHIQPNGDVTVDDKVYGSISANEWHSFGYVMNIATGQYECYIDGTLVVTCESGAGLSFYAMSIYAAGVDTYIDNIKLATVSTKSTAANQYTERYTETSVDALFDVKQSTSGIDTSFIDKQATNETFVVKPAEPTYDLGLSEINYSINGEAVDNLTTVPGSCLNVAGDPLTVWPSGAWGANFAGTFSVFYDANYSTLPSAEIGNDIKFGSSTWYPGFHIKPNGDVTLDGTKFGNISANEWHTFGYVMDTAKSEYECYFDGTCVAVIKMDASLTGANIWAVYIFSAGNGTYVDNIRIEKLASTGVQTSVKYTDKYTVQMLIDELDVTSATVLQPWMGASNIVSGTTVDNTHNAYNKGKLTINTAIVNDGTARTATLYTAHYRGDELISLAIDTVSFANGEKKKDDETVVPDVQAGDKIKVMLWDVVTPLDSASVLR